MAIFKIDWHQKVEDCYTSYLEAETIEEAKQMWVENPWDADTDLIDSQELDIVFDNIKEVD